MSDYSLMNPDYLKSEIRDMKMLIDQDEKVMKEARSDYNRIIDMVAESHNAGKDTVLTQAQTRDLIETLSKFNHVLLTHTQTRRFYLRVYQNLAYDRRWRIAAKYLRFLKK